MDRIITEKDYPVQRLWLLKPTILLLILPMIISVSVVVVMLSVIFSRLDLSLWDVLSVLSKLWDDLSKLWDVLSKNPTLRIHFWLFISIPVISLLIPFLLISAAILRRATFHYSIEDKFLTLRQGVFSKEQRHIPYGVIQTVFLKQDLFDRILGLASLSIEDASQGAGALAAPRQQKVEMVGFSGNKVCIPGLTKAHAEILKGIILQKMKENPIEDSQSGL